MTLIGISGYARVGKSTLAKALTFEGFKVCSFADPVREALLRLNPIIGVIGDAGRLRLRNALNARGGDWDQLKDDHPEVRILLQHLGTEVGRNMLGADTWVELAMLEVDANPDGLWVFPDVRFPNEASAIKERGGHVVRVERPGIEPANAHASETALDGWRFDWTFINGSTVDSLQRRGRWYAQSLLGFEVGLATPEVVHDALATTLQPAVTWGDFEW